MLTMNISVSLLLLLELGMDEKIDGQSGIGGLQRYLFLVAVLGQILMLEFELHANIFFIMIGSLISLHQELNHIFFLLI